MWAHRIRGCREGPNERPCSLEHQDEIVARLANELSTALMAQEARQASKSPNPDSMDYYFQGMAWHQKGIARENISSARDCFERAHALDPGNVDALVGLARMDSLLGGFPNGATEMRRASVEALAKRALSLAPNHALGHFTLGMAYTFTGRAEEGIAEIKRALELDRNYASAHALMGSRFQREPNLDDRFILGPMLQSSGDEPVNFHCRRGGPLPNLFEAEQLSSPARASERCWPVLKPMPPPMRSLISSTRWRRACTTSSGFFSAGKSRPALVTPSTPRSRAA